MEYDTTNKQVADYALAFDMIGNITRSSNKEEVRERIFEFCTILFGPEKILFVTFESGRAQTAYTQSGETEDINCDQWTEKKLTPFGVNASRDGFHVTITCRGTVFGILSLWQIAFPQYLEKYLNLTISVMDVWGMAFENAEKYQEIKQTKGRLLQEKDKLATTLRSIGDGVITTDLAGNVQLVNKVAEKMTGWVAQDALGMPLRNILKLEKKGGIDVLPPCGRSDFNIRHHDNTRLVSKTDRRYDVSVITSPLKDEKNLVSGFVVVVRDITEEKRRENQMAKMQRLSALGRLTGGVAHDFNNALYPIISFTEMSIQELPEDHSVKENLYEVLNAAKRARDVVKQLLSFSEGKKTKIKAVELSIVVTEALRLLKSTLPPNIDLVENISGEPVFVSADSAQIHEIVMNLCINACQGIGQDRGKLEVGVEKAVITETVEYFGLSLAPGSYGQVIVADTGIGMTEDIISNIFDPYFTTKNLAEGSGLGLSVAHGIIKRFNGALDVESEKGKGSIFKMFIPLSSGEF